MWWGTAWLLPWSVNGKILLETLSKRYNTICADAFRNELKVVKFVP
jgi:hypothetical protein